MQSSASTPPSPSKTSEITITAATPTLTRNRLKRLSKKFKPKVEFSREKSKKASNESTPENSALVNAPLPTTSNSSLNYFSNSHEVTSTHSMNSIRSDTTHVGGWPSSTASSAHNDEGIMFRKATIRRRNEAPREALRVSLSARHPEKHASDHSAGGSAKNDVDFRSDMNLYHSKHASIACSSIQSEDLNTVTANAKSESADLTRPQHMNRNVVRKTLKFHSRSIK